MRSGTIAALVAAMALGGCASSLKPLTLKSHATTCGTTHTLTTTICQADEQSAEFMKAHDELWNDPAAFDVPLLGLAGATAGLLLYDASNDVLKGVGLGAGILGAARTYLDPAAMRAALRDASSGYACLADEGKTVDLLTHRINEPNSRNLTRLLQDWADLRSRVAEINGYIQQGATFAGGAENAQSVVNKANEAINLFDKQKTAADGANNTLRKKARSIVIGLRKRIERKAPKFDELVQSLVQQGLAAAQFKAQKAQAQPPPAAPGAQGRGGPPAPRQDTAVSEAQTLTANILEVPDIESAVGKFDKCVTDSLASAT